MFFYNDINTFWYPQLQASALARLLSCVICVVPTNRSIYCFQVTWIEKCFPQMASGDNVINGLLSEMARRIIKRTTYNLMRFKSELAIVGFFNCGTKLTSETIVTWLKAASLTFRVIWSCAIALWYSRGPKTASWNYATSATCFPGNHVIITFLTPPREIVKPRQLREFLSP